MTRYNVQRLTATVVVESVVDPFPRSWSAFMHCVSDGRGHLTGRFVYLNLAGLAVEAIAKGTRLVKWP